MTLEDTLIGHSFEIEKDVNTNNAWGFGGAIKDVYTKDNIIVNIGIAYYRHGSPYKFITVYEDYKRVIDVNNTKANKEKVIKFINDNSPIRL